MKVRVVDFETNDMVGKGRPVEICEAAFTDVLDIGRICRPQARLVNPGLPITAESRGVHHLSDADVADGMSPAEARSWLLEGMEPGDMFAAHHAAFERALFPGDPFPWICTMACAKHIWPKAPGFGNQTLRYHLGIDDEFEWPDLAMPPHRGGPDSYVTAHILSRLSMAASPHRLVELTTTPILLDAVPMGQHEGKPWSEMDRGYLEWVLDPKRSFSPEVLHTARHWLNKLNTSGAKFF